MYWGILLTIRQSFTVRIRKTGDSAVGWRPVAKESQENYKIIPDTRHHRHCTGESSNSLWNTKDE